MIIMKKFFTLILLCFATPIFLLAQWNGSPSLPGNTVCTAPTSDRSYISITDGSGGSIVVFESYDPNSGSHINVQRLTTNGSVVWGSVSNPNTVSIVGDVNLSHAISDGAGGAFITWYHYIDGDEAEVFLQHINNAGNASWTANGINVSNNISRDDYDSQLCLDGTGGVIVTWTAEVYNEETDMTTYAQAFAQRYNNNGIAQWTAGGVQVSTAPGFRGLPVITIDGAGGAIIFFIDTRNSPPAEELDEYSNLDIYAQRLSSFGVRLWSDNGVDVCTEANAQYIEGYQNGTSIVSDGVGGAIVVFSDYRMDNDDPSNIYTQRINSAGVKQWNSSGVPVVLSSGDQYVTNVVSNGAQGFVALWQDRRSTSNRRIYAQQVNATGTALWATNGVLLSNASDAISDADMKTDGLGNYLFAFQVDQSTSGTRSPIIKAQKLNNDGIRQWASGGVTVYTNANDSYISYPQIVTSEAGKGIVTWSEDKRTATSDDLYAKKLEANGTLPLILLEFSATVLRESVLLNWITANEQNTRDFEIQRSGDNLLFNTIAIVNAAGFSTANTAYRFTDINPLTATNFYRLKQNDKDGAFTYSLVRKITINTKNTPLLKLVNNPVSNEAVLKYVSTEKDKVQIRVIEQSGKLMFSKQVSVDAGINQLRLQTMSLPGGIYQIEVSSSKYHQYVKMMKL